MKYVEQAGLVKFDFLGLKTLTVLKKAVEYIADRDIQIDLEQTPLDNKAAFDMMCNGDTVGIFQLESSGMQSVLMNLKPDVFEDIIAVVALYRPGPMDNIPRYISCKHGDEDPDYLHPLLEEILTETYGVIIYQEQVMQIAQILADYSLGDADLLRRAMGKKIASEMDKQRARFQDGADKKGVDPKQAAGIFDQVAKFAGYGFNKSHAAAYALVSYHTAFLKANFAVEFMAAIMTLDLTNTDKLQIFKQELNNLKIPILPPDINKSEVNFIAEIIESETDEESVGGAMSDGKMRGVRYALAGLKNVGAAAMESLIEERSKNGEFKDMDDFCSRVDTRQINKRALENLIKAGAFDTINPNRAQLLQGVEMMLREMNLAAQERNSNQVSLFGDQVDEHTIILPAVNDWDLIEKLNCEKEAVGFYLSAHPLDAYTTVLARQKVISSTEIAERATGKGGVVKLAGTIQGIRKMKSKRGKAYAFLSLSDAHGGFEVTLFSELLESPDEILDSGNSVIINAEVRHSDDGALRITAQGIETIDKAAQRTGTGLDIYVKDTSNLDAIKEILNGHKNGRGRVTFKMNIKHEDFPDCDVDVELKDRYKISPAIRNAVASLKGVVEAKEI
jgi:DNA polymerase-3 subunit alpha